MTNTFTTYAIILAGGIGSRVGKNKPKQLIKINNKPLIIWTLEKFQKIKYIDHIIITTPENYIDEITTLSNQYNISKVKKIIQGGKTRQESAYKSLNCQDYKDNDIILLHDAARPFVNNKIISKCLEKTLEYGAAGTYIKAIDTITEGENGIVKSIPDRNKLYITQTPQCFKYSIIKNAHEYAIENNINVTDDVSLVLSHTQTPISIVDGDPKNIKITNTFDLEIAKLLLK